LESKELVGKVQTVLGPIEPVELGFTSIHEHLLSDLSCLFKEPVIASYKKLAYQSVNIKNLSWVRFNPMNNLDNLRLLNKDIIINELKCFKQAGGKSIVECTPYGLGRDPSGLANIAQVTNINIIMGCGYYMYGRQYPSLEQKSAEEIAEEIERDIIMGVGNTKVCSGIIGEIGCSWPLQEVDKKVLKAVAIAQQHTGASLSIHPGWNERSPFEIIKILEKASADITRTIMDHMGRTILSNTTLLELAKTGCYMGYDNFGREYDAFRPYKYVNDADRIGHIVKLIEKGFIDQIVIARDVAKKIDLVSYGGGGYASLLTSVVPKLLDYGISQESIEKITIDNPKRILTFVKY
jgi:phosphotriesterase-related protein